MRDRNLIDKGVSGVKQRAINGKTMRRRSRRRRTWRRLLKTLCIGFGALLALAVATNMLEVAIGQPALPYLLGGLVLCWIVRRCWRPRTTRVSARSAPPRAASGTEHLHALSPREFEAYVRDLLSSLGYRDLRLTGGAGDLGVDIWGRTPQGRTAAIQCKRYAPGKNIGSPMIQTFIGMQKIHHGADVGLFVTTSGFTRDAKNLAQAHGIGLIDGPALLQLQRQARTQQRRRFGFLRR
jgi:restriction system protein